MNGAAAERGRMVRFAAVSAAGGLLDYVTAAGLILCGAPDFVALLVGIALAGGLSFIAHETWTFRTHRTSEPHGRLLRWTLLVAVSLGLRFVLFRCAEAILPDDEIYRLGGLAAAFVLSAATNYLVSRFLVFAHKP